MIFFFIFFFSFSFSHRLNIFVKIFEKCSTYDKFLSLKEQKGKFLFFPRSQKNFKKSNEKKSNIDKIPLYLLK